MALQCSICLSQFKDPVCLPCGHLYCKNCLTEHVNVPTNRGMTSTCPDCRTPFNLAIPDLTYLPQKYHPFISHAIRRVYADLTPSSPDPTLKKQLAATQARLSQKSKQEELLLRKCESLDAAVHAHRAGEREAHERVEELEERLGEVEMEFGEYVAQARARAADVEAENAALARDNYDLVRRLNELQVSLEASEVRRRALEFERNAYARHAAAADSDSSSAGVYSRRASPAPEAEVQSGPLRSHYKSHRKAPRAHVHAHPHPRPHAHERSGEWNEGRAAQEEEESASAAGNVNRVIKPLPRRLRVTRGRDDDSIVVGATKRARMRG